MPAKTVAKPATTTVVQAVPMPDTQHIDSKSFALLEFAERLVIKDEPTYVAAADSLIRVKDVIKEIDATFDTPTKAAYQAWKAVLAARDKHAEPLELVEKLIKSKMVEYQEEAEAQRKVEEERLRLEAKKAEEEDIQKRAEDLIKNGRPEDALILLEGEPTATSGIIVPTSVPKVKGIVNKDLHQVVVTDLLALVKAVAQGEFPLDFIEANMVKINAHARAFGKNFKVPGCELKTTKGIAVGGK